MNFGAIIGYHVRVRLVFAFVGANMFETSKCFRHVSGHGEVDFTVVVVPIKGNDSVLVAVLINFNIVGLV